MTSDPELEARVETLLARLDTAQRLRLVSGPPPTARALWQMVRAYNFTPIPAGIDVDPEVPGIRFSDGPRGIAMNHSTCFPVAIARGASWDPELEFAVGAAMGREARLLGANVVASPCVNLLRHPAWGRAQETYGEDPLHVGVMGAAHVRGLQRYVMACVKHYALNSIENARFRVDVRVDARTLHELYLPQFRACVEAGCAAVMSAYNRVNGRYCGEHPELLTTILKERWGFAGFVMSDFLLGVRDGVAGFRAGLDLEMPFRWRFRALPSALATGRIPPERLADACRRLLRQQLRFARSPEDPGPPEVVAGPEHRRLARAVAIAGCVLLRNVPVGGRPLLPLAGNEQVAVVGPGAVEPRIGDRGSSHVRPPEVVTIAEGLEAALGPRVRVDSGERVRRAARLAAASDVAIVVVGNGPRDEGEYLVVAGGDRRRLGLRSRERRLLEAILAVQPRTVVLLTGGAPILLGDLGERVPALMMVWYPGMEGGHAVAALLTGEAEPGGRLPCVWPRDAGQLPPFDPRARRIRYAYHEHGQRWFDHRDRRPAWPLGFGLGYGRVELVAAEVAAESACGESLTVQVRLRNPGPRTTSEVVQLYVEPVAPRVPRHRRWLAAFERVSLAPGEERIERLRIEPRRFAWYDPSRAIFREEPGTWRLHVGRHAPPGAVHVLTHQRCGTPVVVGD